MDRATLMEGGRSGSTGSSLIQTHHVPRVAGKPQIQQQNRGGTESGSQDGEKRVIKIGALAWPGEGKITPPPNISAISGEMPLE